MNSISVVLCAYNEQDNVPVVMAEIRQVLESMGVDYEIIAVDDGSQDRTLEAIRHFAKECPRTKIIVHAHNQGIGAALLDGYKMAGKEYVTFLPADGQISCRDIKLLADNMEGHDMVVSYYVERPSSVFRKMTSMGVRLLLLVLFGGMARYEGTYMFRRTLLNKITLNMHTSFVLNYEFVLKARHQGFKIKEVPTKCLERTSGKSKVLGVKKIAFIFGQIIELRFKHY